MIKRLLSSIAQLHLKSSWYSIWQFVRFMTRKFNQDGCQFRAAALTYISMLSVVPFMTVTYAMFMAVPAFRELGQNIQDLIFQHFLPASGAVIQKYLLEFSAQARQLTAVGSIFLVISAYLMLSQIENTLNTIWRVRAPRRGIAKFLLYWSVLSLGPFLLMIGFGVTSYLASLKFFTDVTESLGVRHFLLSITPWGLTTIAFALLYTAVPNCRVNLWHAMLGAAITAFLFEMAKIGFAQLVTLFPTYELVYGAFAAIPLFLIWIFLSWILILMGAEFVHAFSSFRSEYKASFFNSLLVIMSLLRILWEKQQQGLTLVRSEVNQLIALFGHDRWVELNEQLIAKRLVQYTEKGGLVLVQDLHAISLWEIVKLKPAEFLRECGRIPPHLLIHSKRKKTAEIREKLQACVFEPWFQDMQRRLVEGCELSKKPLDISLGELFYVKKEVSS